MLESEYVTQNQRIRRININIKNSAWGQNCDFEGEVFLRSPSHTHIEHEGDDDEKKVR